MISPALARIFARRERRQPDRQIANTVGDLRRKEILDAMLEELRGLVDEARPILRRLYELQ